MKLEQRARSAAQAVHGSSRGVRPREELLQASAPERARRSRALVPPLTLTMLLVVTLVWFATSARRSDDAGQVYGTTAVGAEPPVTDRPGAIAGGAWRAIKDGPNGIWPSTMAWTGREVLVFAGSDSQAEEVNGARYDPRTGRWRAIDRGGLEWRGGEAAVWAGSALIVWGGDSGIRITRDGGIYDPATDNWRRIAKAPLPLQGVLEAVWTGREMVVLTADGKWAAYSPQQDAWRLLPSFPLQGRLRPALVWTGTEVLVWGGCAATVPQCDDQASGADELDDGAAYNPATDRWRPISRSPLAPRDRPEAVWTGQEMLVWGGVVPPGQGGSYGAAYDPASDTWRPLADGPLSARSNHTAVWTGRRMLAWGGELAGHGDQFLADGAAYDPATDAWNPLPAAPLAARDRHVAVWTGTEMVIWGGCCDGDAPMGSGAAFTPS
jgi:hypothetical protein